MIGMLSVALYSSSLRNLSLVSLAEKEGVGSSCLQKKAAKVVWLRGN